MQSISGGTVRYVRVAWVECPEDPDAIGDCTERGTLEVLVQGNVAESFDVRPGDRLLVADGQTVAPKTWLFYAARWERVWRATIPAGVEAIAHWSEAPTSGTVDEVTGLPRMVFSREQLPPADDAVTLELMDGSGVVLVTLCVPRNAIPAMATGATVRRGDTLFRVRLRYEFEWLGSTAVRLRDFLTACPRGYGFARTAPWDGVVESIDAQRVRLRSTDGRPWSTRHKGKHVVVKVGDHVRAGETIVSGERSHQRLLTAWGEARLAEHMIEELEIETARQGLRIPRTYWSLAIRAMLAWRRILHPGNTGLRRHQIVSSDLLECMQRHTMSFGGRPATAVPAMRGFAAMARAKIRKKRER